MKIHTVQLVLGAAAMLLGCEGTGQPTPTVEFVISSSNRNLEIARSAEVQATTVGSTNQVSAMYRVGVSRATVFADFGQPDVIFVPGGETQPVTATDVDGFHVYDTVGLSFFIDGDSVRAITLLNENWICSNLLSVGSLDDAIAILWDNYTVLSEGGFYNYAELGLSLEVPGADGWVSQVNVDITNYD